MQTILGSTGVIGTELAKSLTSYTKDIRLVSRNPRKVNANDELFKADLLIETEVINAVKGSDVAYLTAGLKYDIDIWRSQWPVIMRNVITACKAAGAKLVFFDNVYMYGKVDGWMTEESPVNPCSKKGEVRARIAQMLLDEAKTGSIQALIARAADFYGPRSLGVPSLMVFDNLAKGKKAQCLVTDKTRHIYTYTPDAGKSTAVLGNTSTAYNQVWHLPSDNNALTGAEFIKLAQEAFGVNDSYSVLAPWMIKFAGWFNSNIRESVEMLYQIKNDYLFDSSKFKSAFAFSPKTYKEGIIETAASYSPK